MASSNSKIVLPSVILALRLVAMLLLAGSLALIVTDNVDVRSDFFDEGGRFTLKFKEFYTYRYVLAIAAIGCAYSLVQALLAVFAIATKKRVIGGTANAALFLICADVILALAFATAAGAGYWFSTDADRYVDGLFEDSEANADFNRLHQDLDMFFVRASAAAGLMLLAAKCTAAAMVISVYTVVK